MKEKLVMALADGIKSGELFAFRPSFKNNLSLTKIILLYQTAYRFDKNVIVWPNTLVQRWKPEEITQILVKEVWYFDRNISVEYRSSVLLNCEYRKYLTSYGTRFPMDSIPRMNHLFWILS